MTINRLNQGTTNQVLVKAISGQTTNLLELQDSSGNVVSSIGPTGALGGTVADPYAGVWTTFTPTWTNLTIGNATQTAKYRQIGKIVFFEVRIVFGTTTSITGRISLNWPIAPKDNASAQMANVNIELADVTDGPFPGLKFSATADTTKFELLAINAAGTYAKYAVLSSTVPFTWTTSDEINLAGFYEAA
jgi:hypothetical protein